MEGTKYAVCRSGGSSTSKPRYVAMAASQNGDGESVLMLWTDLTGASLALNVTCCWPSRHCTSQLCPCSGRAI